MGHTPGDALIVASIAAAIVAYLYFQHTERRRRFEVIHAERLAAMDKGIPLPELPLEPPAGSALRDPRAPLIHGIVWLAFGLGGMLMFALMGMELHGRAIWPLPLPLAFLGLGLILFYTLASERAR